MTAAPAAGTGIIAAAAEIEPQNHHQHQDLLSVEGKEGISAVSVASAVSTHIHDLRFLFFHDHPMRYFAKRFAGTGHFSGKI